MYAAVARVSADDITDIEKAREGIRLKRFFASRGLLIITIPTKVHERLHIGLYENIRDEIVQMGLRNHWESTGTTTYREQGYPNGDGGEGDSTGGPRQRSGPQDWPTLVIESGYSQTLEGLRNTIRWWFNASNHQVKIVILAKIEIARGQIIVEKYDEVPAQPRQGATTTRTTATSLEPRLSQVINIARATGNADPLNPTSYTQLVSGEEYPWNETAPELDPGRHGAGAAVRGPRAGQGVLRRADGTMGLLDL
ncbi:Uncharacterized protein TPAR_08020 [Tolypocladium paradoxum]|uniref:Uncharacterized protein n=1 Tax=Tolypocladium paradoxum TaxID=94208 RepID=A0A2S4KNJ5_9HYPO|nr:Uncharacterized protein TPAR_08020 [Tolypocladium paradoxum]